jgi:hypothetical protein
MLETENEMTRYSSGQTIATPTTGTMLQIEASHQRAVLAWGQTLFAELGRVWAQLDTAERLAYEDNVAAQVHVIEEATASLELLSDALGGTCRRMTRHLQSLRT